MFRRTSLLSGRLLVRATLPRLPRQCRRTAIISVKVPTMAESISEGTLKQWSKAVGDSVEADEELTSIETDKIDVAVNSPKAGKIIELLAKEDDTVTVGQEIAKLDTEGKSEASESKQDNQGGNASDSKSSEEAPAAESSEHGRSEPKAPASAEQSSSSNPQPSPPSSSPSPGKPKEADSNTKKDQASSPPAPQPTERKPEQDQEKKASPKETSGREEKRVKMNRMRLRIAERLKQSQNTAASLTTFNEVDMSSLMELRKLYKDDLLKSGIKLGFMGAFSRACILAMKDVPAVNASIEGANGGDTIVYRDYVDVSIAVATEKGLVTPIVRNAEQMSITEIESAISDLGKKARDNKLTLEDMAGGTFTISNGGVFGSLMGTPIINLPQTAVLGLHAIKDRPMAVNGKIEIRPMMYLALTYDHRLLDGREAVTFLVKVKQYIEDPRKMLLR